MWNRDGCVCVYRDRRYVDGVTFVCMERERLAV